MCSTTENAAHFDSTHKPIPTTAQTPVYEDIITRWLSSDVSTCVYAVMQ